MKVSITIDKNIRASIDKSRCINCGICSEHCAVGAIDEYRKNIVRCFESFQESKKLAVKSACSTGCPLGIVPQTVAAFIEEGNTEKAYEHIIDKNPLPEACASICGGQCREYCNRGEIDEPLDMRAMERFVVSRAASREYRFRNKYSERIAIIGGGPAGLNAAFRLAKLGYAVTIFEKDDRLGGAMAWGIPDFRLNKNKLDDEIKKLLSAGIEVRLNHSVGNSPSDDVSVSELRKEGFKAFLICVGASKGVIPKIKGADGEGVYDGVSVLRMINLGDTLTIKPGSKTLVVGSGIFASDTARALLRRGVDVVCVAMDTGEDTDVSEEYEKVLRAEGAEIMKSAAPKQIIREHETIKAVEMVRVEYIEDGHGVMRAQEVRGSEHNVFCSNVVFAASRRSHTENIMVAETYPDGKLKVDTSYRTNKDMIFACGEATGECGSVVQAMAAAAEAALEIDNVLRNRRIPDRRRAILAAGDDEAIYPDNVQLRKPQHERRIFEGKAKPEPAEDVIPVLRSAGIEENMHALVKKKSRADKSVKRVAVAGGGIAGITAALSMAKKGYGVTIFEKTSKLGGRYRWLSSDRRVDKPLLDRELAKVNRAGIETVFNASVGVNPTIDTLKELGYDAVLFAIGETATKKPEMNNSDADGVFDVVTLMNCIAGGGAPRNLGGQAIVCGCDEMSFDAAIKLKEYCSEVTLLIDCSLGAARVMNIMVDPALKSGVNIITGTELYAINAEYGRLSSIKCRIKADRHIIDIPCDTLVIGETQRPDTSAIARRERLLDIDKRGYIVTDVKLAASVEGVFSLGDFKMSAPDSGRAGAAAVDNYLKGKAEAVPVELNGVRDVPENYEIIEGDSDADRGMIEGYEVYDRIQAAFEASRCMKCGYHKETYDKCIGCGICAEKCPVGAIELMEVE